MYIKEFDSLQECPRELHNKKDNPIMNGTITIQKEWYTIAQCKNNPDKIYVFGDNSIRLGTGGQAKIRNEPNTFGVMTKLYPSQRAGSYLEDCLDHRAMVLADLQKLRQLYEAGADIILPADGLGTGLAQLPVRAPKLHKMIEEFIALYTH